MCSRKASAYIGCLATLALVASTIGWAASNSSVAPSGKGLAFSPAELSSLRTYTRNGQATRQSLTFREFLGNVDSEQESIDVGPGPVGIAGDALDNREIKATGGASSSAGASTGDPFDRLKAMTRYGATGKPNLPSNDYDPGFGVRVDCNTNGTDDALELLGVTLPGKIHPFGAGTADDILSTNTVPLTIAGGNYVSSTDRSVFGDDPDCDGDGTPDGDVGANSGARLTGDEFTLTADATLNQVNILCNEIPNKDGFAIQLFTNDPTGWMDGAPGLGGDDPNSTYNADTLIFNLDPIPTSLYSTQSVPAPDSSNCRVNLLAGVALTAPGGGTDPATDTYWLRLYHNSPDEFAFTYGYTVSANAMDANLRRSNDNSTVLITSPRNCFFNRGATDSTTRGQLRWDLREVFAQDFNQNGVPDECDDCNTNGQADQIDIATGTSDDCNTNNNPDVCDVTGGTAFDCNTNTTLDECGEIDCNTNELADECELVGNDCNSNATPDECDLVSNSTSDFFDDGSVEQALGLIGGGRFMWVNQFFVADADKPQLYGVDVNWGPVPVGSIATVLVYSDPNNDGDPNDALLLASQVTLTSVGGGGFSNLFQRVPMSINLAASCEAGAGDPVDLPGGTASYFVAVIMESLGGEFPAGEDVTDDDMDGNADSFNRSWIGFPCTSGGDPSIACLPAEIADLSNANSLLNPNFEIIGDFAPAFIGDWMLRAVFADDKDCNNDCVPDECQVAGNDCNTNQTPDDCETDCDANGTPDVCDIDIGGAQDLDGDGIPDVCQDCNTNGVPDSQDIAGVTSVDCNTDATPDTCEVCPAGAGSPPCTTCFPAFFGDSAGFPDCNTNGVPDVCDGNDCNTNGRPDECDVINYFCCQYPDPTGSGGANKCLQDCNTNEIPDECESDCNTNLLADECESIGGNLDCNSNGTPDLCDLQGGLQNGVPDAASGGALADFAGAAGLVNRVDTGTDDGPAIGEDFPATGRSVLDTVRIEMIECIFGDPLFPGGLFSPDVRITIYGDTAGEPDVLAMYSVDVPATRAFKVGFPGTPAVFDVNEYTAGPGLALPLPTAGTYWITAQPIYGNPDYLVFLATSQQAIPEVPSGPIIGTSARFRPGKNSVGWLQTADINAGNFANGAEDGYAFNLLVLNDCDGNGTPDDCDIARGSAVDVIGEVGVIDSCEDCNSNGVGDLDELAANDCNSNMIPDDCDLASGFAADCNSNGIPDNCEPDCNANGVADDCDIAGPTSTDCQPDGIPDECQDDCDTNNVPDDCEAFTDCDSNGTADICETNPTEFEALTVVGGTRAPGTGLSFNLGFVDLVAADSAFIDPNTGLPFPPNTLLGAQSVAEDIRLKAADGDITFRGLTFLGAFLSIPDPAFNNDPAGACPAPPLSDGDPGAANDVFEVQVWQNTSAFNPFPSEGLSLIYSESVPTSRITRVGPAGGLQQYFVELAQDVYVQRLPGAQQYRWVSIVYTGPSGFAVNGGTFAVGFSDADQLGASFKFVLQHPQNTWRESFSDDRWAFALTSRAPTGAGETVPDCNNNKLPDSCEIAGNDCNSNGTLDECDSDCNTNGTADDCEALADCNTNSIPDLCELAATDANTNGTPDECEPTCTGAPGDMDEDGNIDGDDAAGYVECFITGMNTNTGANCGCADMDGDGDADGCDLCIFIQTLLGDGTPLATCTGLALCP